MSKYLYTPKDIAVLFEYSDFRKSDEKKVIFIRKHFSIRK
jgi:hypothetical protein